MKHFLIEKKCCSLDIDECSRTSSICTNGICENMMGTYQCICNEGYQQTQQRSRCEGGFDFYFAGWF